MPGLATNPLVLCVAASGIVLLTWWAVTYPRRRSEATERSLLEDIAEGRFKQAAAVLVAQRRYAEAARLEMWRGNPDTAASLYERAGDYRGAASVYCSTDDHEMGALVLKEAGLLAEAADAFLLAGRNETALDLFIEAGEVDRAMSMPQGRQQASRLAETLAGMGRHQEADRLLARSLEASWRFGEAAELWLRAGDRERALQALEAHGDFRRMGEVYRDEGELEQAARTFARAGDLSRAGDMWLELGDITTAAQSYYRGGETLKAILTLEQAGEWLLLARLHLAEDEGATALQVLESVGDDSPQWEASRELLIELLERDDRGSEIGTHLEEVVRKRIQRNHIDADLRRWIVKLAASVFYGGDHEGALRWLRRAGDLGLMNPDLERRIQSLASMEGQATPEELRAVGRSLARPTHERYLFEDVLGVGGNGVIYRGRDATLDRSLAIKMISRTALADPQARSSFLREAQTAARLNHPNIVTIFDIGELEGGPFIAMELVDGENLSDRMKRLGRAFTGREVLDLLLPLAEALDYAHREKVVHRDVKLENVMVTPAGEVKLMDFGLALAIRSVSHRNGVIMGTPLYMSPEQLSGLHADHRTDIYALGVMLFRMFTNTWPYEGKGLLEMHRLAPIPRPTERIPALPAALDGVLSRAMAKKPQERTQTAMGVYREVHKALGQSPPGSD